MKEYEKMLKQLLKEHGAQQRFQYRCKDEKERLTMQKLIDEGLIEQTGSSISSVNFYKFTYDGLHYNFEEKQGTQASNKIFILGNNINSPIQQGTTNSVQTSENTYNDIECIVSELRKIITESMLSHKQQSELLETVAEAETAHIQQKPTKAKSILCGVLKVLKDLGVGVAAGIIANLTGIGS